MHNTKSFQLKIFIWIVLLLSNCLTVTYADQATNYSDLIKHACAPGHGTVYLTPSQYKTYRTRWFAEDNYCDRQTSGNNFYVLKLDEFKNAYAFPMEKKQYATIYCTQCNTVTKTCYNHAEPYIAADSDSNLYFYTPDNYANADNSLWHKLGCDQLGTDCYSCRIAPSQKES